MDLNVFRQKVFKPSYQKLKNIFSKITKSKGKWKIYTVLFVFTFFIFLIITIQYAESRQNSVYGKNSAYDIYLPEYNRYEKEIVIKSGETIASILYDIGVSNNYSKAIIESLSPFYNLKKLQPGKKIKFIIFQEGEQSSPFIELLKIEKSPGIEARVCYKNGSYETKLVEVKTIPIYFAKHGVIENTLYGDALKAGIPDSAIMEMFQLFSFDVDFQRDIYRGNKFKMFFRNIINLDGETVSRGDIIFAELETAWKTHKIYSFTGDDGKTDYFNEEGLSIRKTLLKTPIYGARISSGYGNRSHPVEGYNHMHRGLDFAAPKNTPIIASGSGTVELAGWNGGYGNCIIIRHANEYKTLYAHMNGYANGVKKGKYVKQGEIIGYVGTTGVSTGNHLHYEIIFRGQQINPSTIRTPSEKKLSKEELSRFFIEAKKIDEEYENAAKNL
ncbi:MAG: M23 family metallopeptidase [Spirochaetaceae bacterium]|nr:M23 family metallopeptidase [Spirochaetaceae bacterium]